jgi:uncharacterized Zn finger protein
MVSTLAHLVTPKNLRQLAGSRSYTLGEEYYTDGLVSNLVQDGDILVAEVRGTQTYRIKLQAVGDQLKYDCSCPFAAEGAFCKHCVAVGLAWLAGPKAGEKSDSVTMDDVRAYLQRQEKETLVALLVEQALDNSDLQTWLFLRVAQSGANGPNLTTYRRAIDRAVGTGDYVEYDAVPAYARGLEQVADSLRELPTAGYPEVAVELIEYTLAKLEKSIDGVDDSNGMVGGVLQELESMHHEACVLAKPEPRALAQRLYEWQMRAGWSFSEVLDTYADVFGEGGVAEYRRLAEADWALVPVRGPSERQESEYSRHSPLAYVMETLARRSGDVEAVVAVLERDLSYPGRFLKIAQEYHQASQEAKGLEWAERGVRAFSETLDSGLSSFLVDRYRHLGRHDAALAILWQQFMERPVLAYYKPLQEYTDPLGRWAEWRPKALDLLRMETDTEKNRPASFAFFRRSDNSELVRVLMWEGNDESAWQEAQTGGCSEGLWLELAETREKEHPEDALKIYRARIDPLVDPTTNGDYIEPVRLLLKIQRLMKRMGREDEFQHDLQQLRETYKRKRNFLKLLGEKFA